MKCVLAKVICLLALVVVPATVHAEKTILLLVPMTGPVAEWGASMVKGAELAIDEKKLDIKLITEDSQFDAKTGVAVFERVRATRRLDGMVVFGSNVSLGVVPSAESAKLPTISIATSNQIQQGRTYIFRHMISATSVTDALSPEVERRNYQRIAAISTTQDGMLAFQSALVERFGNRVVASLDIAPQERDLRAITSKVLAYKPDAIYLTLLPPQSSLFAKQARQLGFRGEMFAATQVESASELANAGEAFEGLWYVKDGGPQTIAFEKQYLARYGVRADNFAANAYDAISILSSALHRAQPELALKNTLQFDGALGRYGVLSDNSFAIPGMLRVFHEGRITQLHE